MRRTQLYLDDELWSTLHARAVHEGATISELVRVAVRERYMGNLAARRDAMLNIVGLWKGRSDVQSAEAFIRDLRNDSRQKRLAS